MKVCTFCHAQNSLDALECKRCKSPFPQTQPVDDSPIDDLTTGLIIGEIISDVLDTSSDISSPDPSPSSDFDGFGGGGGFDGGGGGSDW